MPITRLFALFTLTLILTLILTACNDRDDARSSPELKTGYIDADGDGYGSSYKECVVANNGSTIGCVDNHNDCDDEDAAVYPGAPEIWYDGVDQNCDNRSDYDQDYDGHNSIDHGGDDCDDVNMRANPDAFEHFNGYDDDCDGKVDESESGWWFVDNDHDGYGDSSKRARSGSFGFGVEFDLRFVTEGGDCNDADYLVHPEAIERINDIDDDCDGMADENFRYISK
jgi:hypothetical protein